jgi:hypothetical protein
MKPEKNAHFFVRVERLQNCFLEDEFCSGSKTSTVFTNVVYISAQADAKQNKMLYTK